MVETSALPALEPALAGDLASHAVLDARELRGAELGGINAANVRLLESAIVDCSADELTTPGVSAVDTFVGGINVQTWRAHNGAWRDATFESARIGAWLADGTEFIDVVLRGSKIDLLSLRGSAITRLAIADCTIETLDLSGAKVEGLSITGGRVRELVTTDAAITALDVSATDLATVSAPAHLRGLVISQQQLSDLAPAFAAHMGLVVRD